MRHMSGVTTNGSRRTCRPTIRSCSAGPDEQVIGADAVTESTTEELANRDQYAFKAMPPRIIDARESGDIGWTITESRWEFEDGSYVPVRGFTVLHREDGVWKAIAGSQHPRSPTNCFDRDHRSHSQPAPPPSLAWSGALSGSGFFSIDDDQRPTAPRRREACQFGRLCRVDAGSA